MNKKNVLGRGLASLLSPVQNKIGPTEEVIWHVSKKDYFICPIEQIAASPNNPRQQWDEQSLSMLAASIQSDGIIQPLVVRHRNETDKVSENIRFILIAGERRFRAAQLAKITSLPVLIRDVDNQKAFELAMIENLYRQDLNPIEEALAYSQLVEDFGYTQQSIALKMGQSREAIANTLRLLKLPQKLQAFVIHGQLTAGHARALLMLKLKEDKVLKFAQQVIKKNLNVRQTEQLVQKMNLPHPVIDSPEKDFLVEQTKQFFDSFKKETGLSTKFRIKNGQGSITISFRSSQELEKLQNYLKISS